MAVGSCSPYNNRAEVYNFETTKWTTVAHYPFRASVFSYGMVFIPEIKATVVIGGSDPNDYGSYLTQIAMFSHDDNIWIDAGQLNEARYVSYFFLIFIN